MKGGNTILRMLDSAQATLPVAGVALQRLRDRVESTHFRSLEDRRFFSDRILPFLASQSAREILYVGCRSYTEDAVARLGQSGARVWTTDIDPDAARYGNGEHHRTLDITEITSESFPVSRFDMICLNGIIGHGVDADQAIAKLLLALSRVLVPGGLLLIGWNRGRSSDPMGFAETQSNFEPVNMDRLASRTGFASNDHVFDMLVRRDSGTRDHRNPELLASA